MPAFYQLGFSPHDRFSHFQVFAEPRLQYQHPEQLILDYHHLAQPLQFLLHKEGTLYTESIPDGDLYLPL